MPRRPRFSGPSVTRSLHLPQAFWDALDRQPGSRSDAFVRLLLDEDDDGRLALRQALEADSLAVLLPADVWRQSRDGLAEDGGALFEALDRASLVRTKGSRKRRARVLLTRDLARQLLADLLLEHAALLLEQEDGGTKPSAFALGLRQAIEDTRQAIYR